MAFSIAFEQGFGTKKSTELVLNLAEMIRKERSSSDPVKIHVAFFC